MDYRTWLIREHTAWRKKVNRRIPNLANRVFSLREKGYSGCGFHYAMEQDLGKQDQQHQTIVKRKAITILEPK